MWGYCSQKYYILATNNGYIPAIVLDFVLRTNCMYSPGHTAIHVDGGLEAEYSEDDDTRVDGSDCIADRHQEHVSDAVVLGRIVAAEGNQRAKG